MKQNNRAIGQAYEQMAGSFLESCGYKILAYNYRCKLGELDIVARDGDTYVFCEVKYRKDSAMGDPSEAVDQEKRRRISRGAMTYLKEHRLWDVSCRFDVISILGEELTHIENAFELL